MNPTPGPGPLDALLAIPVHPAVVHFPIAFLVAAWVLVVAGHLAGRPGWLVLADTFERPGVALAPLALLTGLGDAGGTQLLAIPLDQPLPWHALLAAGAVAVFGLHAGWRLRVRDAAARRPGLDLALASAGCWLLVGAGMLGAELVHG